MPSLSARIIGAIIAGVVALLVIWAACHFWQKSRSQAAQARVERSQAGAASNSAADAINTVASSAGRETASEELTRSNEKEIRAAQGADARVGAGVNAAGRSALCRREAYRNDPKCKGARP